MKDNSIIFSCIDKEDYWVSSGLCLKIENIKHKNYEEIYEEIKHKIESEDVIKYVIDDNNIEFKLFGNDKTYKFKRTYWDYVLVYEFENADEDIVEFRFDQTDTILSL